MKEHQIPFKAPMVRAILDGTKTQTRRIVKPQPHHTAMLWHHGSSNGAAPFTFAGKGIEAVEYRCPYGQPGDHLWVSETFADLTKTHGRQWERFNQSTKLYERGVNPFVWYRADGEQPDIGNGIPLSEPWCQSIHMPRWASRITLEVTGVRVERLQDISEQDALAEGIQEWIDGGEDHDGYPRDAFGSLWESINGAGSWNSNPWVWVIEFKQVSES